VDDMISNLHVYCVVPRVKVVTDSDKTINLIAQLCFEHDLAVQVLATPLKVVSVNFITCWGFIFS